MKKTRRAVVNTTALSLDWKTYDCAQAALDPFRTGARRGVDIVKHPHEWHTAANLLNIAAWEAGRSAMSASLGGGTNAR